MRASALIPLAVLVPFTAIAQDNYGRVDTNTVSSYLPLTTTLVYDLNGNLRTNGSQVPTFSIDELKTLVDEAHSAGRPVSAHAITAEGMRRAALAGVDTIEHGYYGTEEVFRMMVERHIA